MPTATMSSEDYDCCLDTFWKALEDTKHKIKVIYGGAGSGKSVAVAQYLVWRFAQERDTNFLIMRKTRPSLKMTCWPLIKKILRKANIPFEENKSDLTLSYRGNVMYFVPLDDAEKVKSFESKYIWIEETTEVNKEDFLQLSMRTLRTSSDSVYILTFNPVDSFHWCITDLVQGNRPDVLVHHSTYHDNPFLSSEFRWTLEDLINRDENFYRVYCLGQPGVLKNIVFPKYEVMSFDDFPRAVRERKPDCYGLDFGFVSPMTVVALWRYEGRFYWHELYYETAKTITQLIGWLRDSGIDKATPIEADSAEPGMIQEICNAGWNARPTQKETIQGGIDYIKSHGLTISTESVNLLKEIRAYKYKEDKNGNVLDEPVDFMNHAIDAGRYACLYFKKMDITFVGGFGERVIW